MQESGSDEREGSEDELPPQPVRPRAAQAAAAKRVRRV
jgi:hypothetical protein